MHSQELSTCWQLRNSIETHHKALPPPLVSPAHHRDPATLQGGAQAAADALEALLGCVGRVLCSQQREEKKGFKGGLQPRGVISLRCSMSPQDPSQLPQPQLAHINSHSSS